MTYASHFNARRAAAPATVQSLPIPGRESEMVANAAGGMVFKVDTFDRLRRFLVLGSDAPTYYAGSRELTIGNIEGVLAALDEDGLRVVQEIREISMGGRAPKNDSALYALALASSYGVRGKPGVKVASRDLGERLACSGNPNAELVRRVAFAALPDVARTGTFLMQYVGFLSSLRGWGRGPRTAVAAWFESMDDEKLSLQAVKYRQRGGWTLRDILRLGHPAGIEGDRRALVDWIAHRDVTAEGIAAHDARLAADAPVSRFSKAAKAPRATPRRHEARPGSEVVADARAAFRLVDGYHLAQEAASAKAAARIVLSHGIPLECVPDRFLKDRDVWAALLDGMPMNALVRNLNRMTAVGVITHGSEAARYVAGRLVDEDELRKARVHPFKLLMALRVYQGGKGILGDLTWSPATEVVDALDAGFYAAFKTVEPSGKRFVLGLDVSGSMGGAYLSMGNRKAKAGYPTQVPGPLTARDASAAMAMVTMATEPACFVGGFTAGSRGRGRSDGFTPLDISPRRRLDDVIRTISDLPFGGTDASLPIAYATEHGIAADAFVIYTDNESWHGKEHVTQALRRYRDKTGIPAKLVAVGMTATDYSVVDPADGGQMNVAGFDAEAPAMITDFVRG